MTGNDNYVNFTDLLKEATGENEKKELPGFEFNTKRKVEWKIKLKLFDMTSENDILELEKIYTESANILSDPNINRMKSGIKILKESGQFFDNGVYKIMLQWGEWNIPESKIG